MSTIKELQDEEREALVSIYEGDQLFKEVNPLTFQYKVSGSGPVFKFQTNTF